MVGKPVVKGTRIPVERVVAHLAHNPDLKDLFVAYPGRILRLSLLEDWAEQPFPDRPEMIG